MSCSKLLNSCMLDVIDERALNLPAGGGGNALELPRREALQNSALCVNAAKALGCSVAGVSAEDIVEGRVRSPLWYLPAACSVLQSRHKPLCQSAVASAKAFTSSAVAHAQENVVLDCVWQFIKLGVLKVWLPHSPSLHAALYTYSVPQIKPGTS